MNIWKYTKVRMQPLTAYIAPAEGLSYEDTASPVRFGDGTLGFEFENEGLVIRAFDQMLLDAYISEDITPRNAALQLAYVNVSITGDGTHIVSAPLKEGGGISTCVGEEALARI